MCTHHVPPNHGTYPCLHHTHVYYPFRPHSRLVPYSCATASYHIPFTYSSILTHPLFSTIHLPHLVCFLIPVYITDTSPFYLHQRPYASFLDPVLYLASFTISPFIPSFRLRPSPVYKPLSRRLSLKPNLISNTKSCSVLHYPLVCFPLVRDP
jgi:hypothetical protein